ncbi:MAG: DUF4249 family protein [Spirosomataceae bacterium]
MFFLFGCEEELRDFRQAEQETFVTIEATFSNLEKFHKIYLNESSPNISGDTSPKAISGAEVQIVDSLGEKILFSEIGEGVYQSVQKVGAISGHSYKLSIRLKNGKRYGSDFQQLMYPPQIVEIKDEFVLRNNFPENNAQRYGFNITVDFEDSKIPGQYYQWDWIHYERVLYCASCNNGFDYGKNDCSRTDENLPYYEKYNSDRPINYRCGNNCFDISRPPQFVLFADNLLNGQKISDFPVARIPYDGTTDYYFELEMRTIHAEVYNYLNQLKETTQSNGSLFDIPANTPFSPNIKCVTDPKEKVLGVFSVFGAHRKQIYIKRNNLPSDVRPIFPIYQGREAMAPPGSSILPTVPCKEAKYRTKQEPENWHD